jgi:hypothetical protein
MNIKNIDTLYDYLKVLDWQDSKAINFQTLLSCYGKVLDMAHKDFWEYFEEKIYNLKSLDEFGAKVWSINLGIPLFGTNTPSPPDYPAFGFGTESKNFNNGNFATQTNSPYKLTLKEKIQLLQLRYVQLHSRGNNFQFNRFLDVIFGDGTIYVIDNMDMTADVVVNGYVSLAMLDAIQQLDVMPRPSAVEYRYMQGEHFSFGFSPDSGSFNYSNFVKDGDTL